MALVLADRVRETSTTTGTGALTLGGAVPSYQSFSAVGNSNTTYYTIVNQSANEWEVGIGTYTASGTTLSRDTVLASSNSGSLVNFSAGTKDVWGDYPAGKAVTTDTLAYPPAIGATTPAAATFTTLTATGQTSLGGAAGSEGLRVLSVASTVNWVQARGHITNNAPSLRAAGADTNIGLGLSSQGTGAVSFYTNSISQEQFRVSHTASAVNYVQVTGAAAGAGASTLGGLLMTGSDSNPSLAIGVKGTAGYIAFYGSNSSASQAFRILSANASATGNLLQVQGAASGNVPTLSAISGSSGPDANISMAFVSKGTGAIDLAAGSSGVNISNGTTVTAITGTAGGSYTTIPTVTISPPTTAGGVQATATVGMAALTTVLANGGTGYSVNDVLTFSGGTFSTPISVTVTGVSAGVITTFTTNNGGTYTALPTNPISVTGGTGTGATFNVTAWQVRTTAFTITNAGSGYVEQPTVTFSGGGGSGATAFATIGSANSLRALNDLTVNLPSGPVLSMTDSSLPGTGAYLNLSNGSTSSVISRAVGTNTNLNFYWLTKGTGAHYFNTNNSTSISQFVVSHTASAVNYVQVTGGATGVAPTISSQGSDSNIPLTLLSKGNNGIVLQTRGGGTARTSLQLSDSGSASVNYMQVQSNIAGAAPVLSVLGTDTNIDLALTPKGTGNVRFGTYTANMALTVQGYIEIKDSGGTVRKLAVIA